MAIASALSMFDNKLKAELETN
jgi:hypothetical protein